MSIVDPAELSLSPACRILVVSGDLAHSKELVGRVQPLTDTLLKPHSDDEYCIEWMISNKYYTAPVHMLLHQAPKPPAKPLWPPESDGERVPALIFVFRKGEAYQDIFLSMREGYLAHDPEVALAVALPSPSNISVPSSTESIEEFFAGHNFEYIDAEDDLCSASEAEDLQYDISGLPRILEALNMIMWPSMVRTSHGGLRHTTLASDIDDGPDYDTFDKSFATVSDTAPPHHLSLFDGEAGPSTQSLVELNAWLDNDNAWVHSTVETHLPPSFNGAKAGTQTNATGFEDDFSDFLSVPPIDGRDTSLPSSVDVQATAERIFDPHDHDDAPGGFDLTSVLGSLEAMRAEISGITDMDERRKAAARVALGLAMGLGLDDDEEDELDEELLRELHQM